MMSFFALTLNLQGQPVDKVQRDKLMATYHRGRSYQTDAGSTVVTVNNATGFDEICVGGPLEAGYRPGHLITRFPTREEPLTVYKTLKSCTEEQMDLGAKVLEYFDSRRQLRMLETNLAVLMQQHGFEDADVLSDFSQYRWTLESIPGRTSLKLTIRPDNDPVIVYALPNVLDSTLAVLPNGMMLVKAKDIDLNDVCLLLDKSYRQVGQLQPSGYWLGMTLCRAKDFKSEDSGKIVFIRNGYANQLNWMPAMATQMTDANGAPFVMVTTIKRHVIDVVETFNFYGSAELYFPIWQEAPHDAPDA